MIVNAGRAGSGAGLESDSDPSPLCFVQVCITRGSCTLCHCIASCIRHKCPRYRWCPLVPDEGKASKSTLPPLSCSLYIWKYSYCHPCLCAHGRAMRVQSTRQNLARENTQRKVMQHRNCLPDWAGAALTHVFSSHFSVIMSRLGHCAFRNR